MAIRGLYHGIRSTNLLPSFFDYLFLQAYQEFSQNQSPTFPAQQKIGIFLLSVCHPDIAGLE
jgi:hypothetical protein